MKRNLRIWPSGLVASLLLASLSIGIGGGRPLTAAEAISSGSYLAASVAAREATTGMPFVESGAIPLTVDGHQSVLLEDIEGETSRQQAEAAGYDSFIELDATQEEGGRAADSDDSGSSLPVPALALIGGIAVVLLGGGAWYVRSRSAGPPED